MLWKIRGPAWFLFTAILLAAPFHVRSVRAEALVSGEPHALRVDVRDASVDEVMAALGASFGLQYRSPASVSRRVTGTYQGSLQRVVARLLDGYNFVMKTDSEGIEVWVYGAVKPGEAVLLPKPVEVARPRPAARTRQEAKRKRHAL